MKMINYLASEEGQYLLMWGIEGTNWNMEDGKHVPNDDLIEGFLSLIHIYGGKSELRGDQCRKQQKKSGFPLLFLSKTNCAA